jgi:hypothetical protein
LKFRSLNRGNLRSNGDKQVNLLNREGRLAHLWRRKEKKADPRYKGNLESLLHTKGNLDLLHR